MTMIQNTPTERASQEPARLETATFAMGCFWSVDALFGSLEGVLRTRVGYTGGSTQNPTYWSLADHTETVELDYDPSVIGYQELLHTFFRHHNPIGEPWKRQYMSAVFYHNKTQQQLVEQTIENVATERGRKIYTGVFPYEQFYLAEDRHQKYKLQRYPILLAELQKRYSGFRELVDSIIAARVNGYLYGYGERKELESTLEHLGLSSTVLEILFKKVPVAK